MSSPKDRTRQPSDRAPRASASLALSTLYFSVSSHWTAGDHLLLLGMFLCVPYVHTRPDGHHTVFRCVGRRRILSAPPTLKKEPYTYGARAANLDFFLVPPCA